MKFATIAVIALVAVQAKEVKVVAKKVVAKKGSCGVVVTTQFALAGCKKAGVAGKATALPSDVCTAKKMVTCDTKGVTTTTYTDAKCTKVSTTKKAVTTAWGACVAGKVGFVTMKGAEALKMAVTGAALALVASQF